MSEPLLPSISEDGGDLPGASSGSQRRAAPVLSSLSIAAGSADEATGPATPGSRAKIALRKAVRKVTLATAIARPVSNKGVPLLQSSLLSRVVKGESEVDEEDVNRNGPGSSALPSDAAAAGSLPGADGAADSSAFDFSRPASGSAAGEEAELPEADGAYKASASSTIPDEARLETAARFVRDAIQGRNPNIRLAAASGLAGAAGSSGSSKGYNRRGRKSFIGGPSGSAQKLLPSDEDDESTSCCMRLLCACFPCFSWSLEDLLLSHFWKWTLQIIIVCHCVLSAFEYIPPSTQTPPFQWWPGIVELCFLIVYTFDQLAIMKAFGLHHYKDKRWEAVGLIVVVALWIDWTLFYPAALHWLFRFARPFRPLLGLSKRKSLRRLLATILRTVPPMIDISGLLFVMLFFFGTVGLQLFNDEQCPGYHKNDDNFNTWYSSSLAIYVSNDQKSTTIVIFRSFLLVIFDVFTPLSPADPLHDGELAHGLQPCHDPPPHRCSLILRHRHLRSSMDHRPISARYRVRPFQGYP
jgi:Ion transport protein